MTAKQRHLSIEDYLDHIEEAAILASDYVSGMTRETFLNDRKTQQAVIYNIMIIGEAAPCQRSWAIGNNCIAHCTFIVTTRNDFD